MTFIHGYCVEVIQNVVVQVIVQSFRDLALVEVAKQQPDLRCNTRFYELYGADSVRISQIELKIELRRLQGSYSKL